MLYRLSFNIGDLTTDDREVLESAMADVFAQPAVTAMQIDAVQSRPHFDPNSGDEIIDRYVKVNLDVELPDDAENTNGCWDVSSFARDHLKVQEGWTVWATSVAVATEPLAETTDA